MALDQLTRAEIRVDGKSFQAFRVCGYAGFAAALLLSVSLSIYVRLSPFVVGGIAVTGAFTFFAVVLSTRALTGEEKIIYYHHEIAVGVSAGLLLWLLDKPALPYLDLTLLGVGTFLCFGRFGCFMVGCCHGRPQRWGVAYRKEHADAGFPHYLVGVRLFPIQLVESLWSGFVVLTGVYFILNHFPPGTAFAWYVIAYSVGRFFLEFSRGDSDRPYLFGFSQPQWISLALMCAAALAEWFGLLPVSRWHIVAAGWLGLVMAGVAIKRRFEATPRYALLHPRHIREIAEIIDAVSEPENKVEPRFNWTVRPRSAAHQTNVRVGCTSEGVKISSGGTFANTVPTHHYTLSCRTGAMPEGAARLLADLISGLKHPDSPTKIVRGNSPAVFHLLVQSGSGKDLVQS